MIVPGVLVAFFVGLIVEAVAIQVLDRRAVRREAEFWEDLRARALDGYGRVFDWAKECEEFGCHEDTP